MDRSATDTASQATSLAADLTRRSASNLWFVGRALPSRKRKLFEAAYATMRVVDDFVDDTFLARGPVERAETRQAALSYIDQWEQAAVAALDGYIAETGDPRDDALFDALRIAAVGSDIPCRPWNALAEAMRFDVTEGRLTTWQDFEAYCDGATVAPAAVFLHVLHADATTLHADLTAAALFDKARAMATFCYLVHIQRDFAKDHARGGQLLTVPQECAGGPPLPGSGPDACLPVLTALAERAAVYREMAKVDLAAMSPDLAVRERGILEALFGIYEGLQDDLNRDPMPCEEGRRRVTARLRETLLDRLGLA
ncbi:squalene/phytoene synthase family protein [Rhodospirillaceae bacterium KN72]|uniref:Squalene/phytoene synthase family protein n=1 Tax=Pacificispira spongiicola TaxID=2729598 RepID=A0A7Y0HI67_9PROT|nr:squalene/phytoene synthase family protein [Pacificispira spongiicola]NMM46194.1 squalene/phytoene synthase family protein [Pacificispira spongiicola]